MKVVLSIAGSDCSGGAGIQADIKTITAQGLYAETVITALTAQNTCGVAAIKAVSPSFIGKQMKACFKDIRPNAVKVGMVFSPEIIDEVAQRLTKYKAKNVVVDPVMVATAGSDLMESEAFFALRDKLLPLATVITPNIPEAEVLAGMEINSHEDMMVAAERIGEFTSGAILIKGGHTIDDANDYLLMANRQGVWFEHDRVATENTHGTGCSLSSAIACGLAKGFSIKDSVREAKRYVTGALSADLDLGHGNGPINHMWELRR